MRFGANAAALTRRSGSPCRSSRLGSTTQWAPSYGFLERGLTRLHADPSSFMLSRGAPDVAPRCLALSGRHGRRRGLREEGQEGEEGAAWLQGLAACVLLTHAPRSQEKKEKDGDGDGEKKEKKEKKARALTRRERCSQQPSAAAILRLLCLLPLRSRSLTRWRAGEEGEEGQRRREEREKGAFARAAAALRSRSPRAVPWRCAPARSRALPASALRATVFGARRRSACGFDPVRGELRSG